MSAANTETGKRISLLLFAALAALGQSQHFICKRWTSHASTWPSFQFTAVAAAGSIAQSPPAVNLDCSCGGCRTSRALQASLRLFPNRESTVDRHPQWSATNPQLAGIHSNQKSIHSWTTSTVVSNQFTAVLCFCACFDQTENINSSPNKNSHTNLCQSSSRQNLHYSRCSGQVYSQSQNEQMHMDRVISQSVSRKRQWALLKLTCSLTALIFGMLVIHLLP